MLLAAILHAFQAKHSPTSSQGRPPRSTRPMSPQLTSELTKVLHNILEFRQLRPYLVPLLNRKNTLHILLHRETRHTIKQQTRMHPAPKALPLRWPATLTTRPPPLRSPPDASKRDTPSPRPKHFEGLKTSCSQLWARTTGQQQRAPANAITTSNSLPRFAHLEQRVTLLLSVHEHEHIALLVPHAQQLRTCRGQGT